jgi:hypothetical protein
MIDNDGKKINKIFCDHFDITEFQEFRNTNRNRFCLQCA